MKVSKELYFRQAGRKEIIPFMTGGQTNVGYFANGSNKGIGRNNFDDGTTPFL
jgi:hypothetical protein